jgi:hypothetical protein
VKRKKDMNEVQGDFQLCAVDVVGTPSAPDAFTQGIMEGVDWIWDNGILKPADIKSIVEMVEVAYKHKKTEFKEEDLEKAFSKFMNSL